MVPISEWFQCCMMWITSQHLKSLFPGNSWQSMAVSNMSWTKGNHIMYVLCQCSLKAHDCSFRHISKSDWRGVEVRKITIFGDYNDFWSLESNIKIQQTTLAIWGLLHVWRWWSCPEVLSMSYLIQPCLTLVVLTDTLSWMYPGIWWIDFQVISRWQ